MDVQMEHVLSAILMQDINAMTMMFIIIIHAMRLKIKNKSAERADMLEKIIAQMEMCIKIMLQKHALEIAALVKLKQDCKRLAKMDAQTELV